MHTRVGRPAFFKCFEWNEGQEGKEGTLDKLFDVPTAMSVLRENVRNAKDEDDETKDLSDDKK